MTTQGPTTVATIQGILDMDRSRWIAAIASTREEATALGQIQPTIRVDANVAEAMAAIESVRAAEAGLGGNTTGVTVGGSGPSAGELAATAGLTEAERRHEAAARDAAVSEVALDAAQEASADSAVQEAGAQTVLARATNQANAAHSTSGGRIGTIIAAVAALLPLMVPLAAGAIGIAGALGLMGLAGVASIVGIKQQMEQGTAVGQQYSAVFGILKGNLTELSTTGALNMLGSLEETMRITAASMPVLNRETGEFTKLLGLTGTNFLQGALTALRIMEPLLLTAGAYVQSLAQKFNLWTSDGGLETFTNFALSNLPTVERVLGALSTAVLHILEALAPMGTVGLTVLTAVSEVIDAIPVDVLGALIAAITWGTVAFKAWGFIVPMIESIKLAIASLSATTEVSLGPIGWIIAGVTALVAIFTSVAAAQSSAADAQKNYTQAVTQDTGVIGENIKAKAASALQDAGAFDAAQRLGISTKLVTDATLGNTDAQKELDSTLTKLQASIWGTKTKAQDLTNAQQAQSSDIRNLRDAYTGQNDAIVAQIAAYNLYQTAIGGVVIATDSQRIAIETNAAAAGVSTGAYLAALSGQEDTQLQTEKTTASMYLQSDAAGLLKQSLDLLNGKTISAAQAQNQFDSQLTNMSDHIDGATGNIDGTKTSLDGMSDSAVKNRGELINLTQSATANAQAIRDNGGSADETRQKLVDMRQSIIDNAVAHGEDRDAVTKYIDEIFKIPEKVPPTKLEVDAAAAQATIDQFLAANSGKRVNIAMGVGGSGGQVEGKADGGTVSGYGSSSVDSKPHMLAPGEEVISNKAGQAGKYRSILKQINAGQAPSLPTMGAAGTLPGSSSAQAATTSLSTNDNRQYHTPISVVGVSDPYEAANVTAALLHHGSALNS